MASLLPRPEGTTRRFLYFTLCWIIAGCSGDRGGFVTLPAADGHDNRQVYVVAAENAAGIPAARTHVVDFSQLRAQAQTGYVPEAMIEQARQLNGIMGGELPVVFVRGRAKNNPTLKEVINEYKRSAR